MPLPKSTHRSISFFHAGKHSRDLFWKYAQEQEKFLYNVALKYTGNRYDAEDLVQETLYAAYRHFHQLREKAKFKSWIFTILRNGYLKSQHNKSKIQIDEFDEGTDYVERLEKAVGNLDFEAAYEKKVELETIQMLMNKIPEKYKTILILYFTEENSYQEIAGLLDIPIGTVMSRLARAKKIMKKAILRSTLSGYASTSVIRLKKRGGLK